MVARLRKKFAFYKRMLTSHLCTQQSSFCNVSVPRDLLQANTAMVARLHSQFRKSGDEEQVPSLSTLDNRTHLAMLPKDTGQRMKTNGRERSDSKAVLRPCKTGHLHVLQTQAQHRSFLFSCQASIAYHAYWLRTVERCCLLLWSSTAVAERIVAVKAREASRHPQPSIPQCRSTWAPCGAVATVFFFRMYAHV